MRKGMTVTYEVDGSLYINMTNRCSNRCSFCIRNNGDGAYGSEPLWLLREPTVEEVLNSLYGRNLDSYREIVFCGYGEPSYRLDDAVYVAKELKASHPNIRIRINTNGQSDLIHGEVTAPKYAGAFDAVSISLNAASAEKYTEMCRPVYGNAAFAAIIEFAKNVKNYVQNVAFSVVRQTLSEEELRECERISRETGVNLRVRDYISQ